ncbi:MAG TPA: alpha/beta hydrolase [Candidatus Limnocylindrales bacterium]
MAGSRRAKTPIRPAPRTPTRDVPAVQRAPHQARTGNDQRRRGTPRRAAIARAPRGIPAVGVVSDAARVAPGAVARLRTGPAWPRRVCVDAGRYRLWDYAADMIALLERFIGEPAAIVGHSMGGEVAVIVAAERPDLVTAVIAIDAPLSADEARRTVLPDRERLAWLRSLHALSHEGVATGLREMPMRDRATGRVVRAGDVFGDDDALFADQAETLLHNDPTMLDAVIEFDAMHAGYDAERLLPAIACPVLLLMADAELGSAVSTEHAHRAVQLLRDGQLIRVAGSTHGLVWEEPDVVLRAIEAFLAGG